MSSVPPPPGNDRPPTRPDARALYLSLHAVNVFVRDLERSLQFYRDQLGFDVVFDGRLHSGKRWVGVAPPDGSAVLALLAPEPDSPEFKLIGRPTSVVFVTEDVVAKFSEWRQRGVRFRHSPRLRQVRYARPAAGASDAQPGAQEPVWGGVFTRFEDIDRNSFALVSFDEVTHEVETRRRALAEKLEAERRAAQELEIAKQVQAGLFPHQLPALRTLDYSGICIQARAVGGDYYDFLNLGAGRLGLVIGDVSGKGIAAALLMANLQAHLRSLCAIAIEEPARLLRSVNQLFCANTTDSAYATLFFGEYDDTAQRLRYASCGHLSGIVLRRDGAIERLESTATVLGLFETWDCEIGECRLLPGDLLALYTDGITETFNPRGEEFGERRLTEALGRHRDLPARDLLAAIVAEVQQFSPQEQHDDITLIVARCREA